MMYMYDIIVFEIVRFRPSTRRRKAGVFKNLHSGQRFWKDAFSVTVFTEFEWTVGQTGEKILVFKQKGICVDRAWEIQIYSATFTFMIDQWT